MMDDYISRQAAINLVKDVCGAIMSGCESWYDPDVEDEVYKDILEVNAILKCNKEIRIALRNMPSAQPKIIRCKDCKFQDEGYRRIAVRWLPCMEMRTGGNWFCGSAERRDDETV